MQFVEGKFKANHDLTIGVEFGTKTVQCHDKTIKLQIWDTAGQENFRSLTRSYYRAAVGAILVYDITRRKTFEALDAWVDDLKINASSHVVIMLVGNKSDNQDKREVSYEEGKKFAEDHGLLFFETSARNADHVNEAFMQMTETVCDKIQAGTINIARENSGVRLGDFGSRQEASTSGEDQNSHDSPQQRNECAC